MRHIAYGQSGTYPVAILIKNAALNKQEIQKHYVDPLVAQGLDAADIVAMSLDYNQAGKAPVKHIKAYLQGLLPALDDVDTCYLFTCDSDYFKVLAGVRKSEPHYGYTLPCVIPGYEHMHVTLGLNYRALFYDPQQQPRLDLCLHALASSVLGNYQALGTGVIQHAEYPAGHTAIEAALNRLHQYPVLSADIETFSLRFQEAGIATIGFAWDQHSGMAFACDYRCYQEQPAERYYGYKEPNQKIRKLIRKFFETYQGKLRWHNAPFDFRCLIYTLWMKDALDTEGLITGLKVMSRLFDDTKIIAYLATNSTAGNTLGLKPLSHPHTGNYAIEELQDVRKTSLPKLLEYNLVDCLGTNYVYDTYYPIMVQDNQEDLYKSLMLESLVTITQMELTGMPLSAKRVKAVRAELEAIRDQHEKVLRDSPAIKMLNLLVQEDAQQKANAKLKVKQHPLSHFEHKVFNPNSDPQCQYLLYTLMGLPVLEYTKTKQPSVKAKAIEKLIHHTQDPDYKLLLNALIEYKKVDKILTTFIPAFERALEKSDGMIYLHGNFNLGGTVSGRLSSNDPNLQNLPSGSTYGKLIKSCFEPPEDWLMVGADFASLEDRINALLTKDPNKLKVYTDGFDGHCLRTYHYWPELFPHLRETPEDINSIDETHKDARSASKTPTFALTYQGTYKTLMTNSGFTEEEAKRIEANYHQLYAVSTQWTKDKIVTAAQHGYAEVAFGLRIRTPLLKQTLLGHRTTPYEAEAEARTLGNAISGQSYGLLNNRAANEFMQKVWASPYWLDVKPIAMIHDAIYLLIRNDVEVVEWVNRELIKSMEWQDLPEIQHPDVKLGAELDIFWPNWSNAITLPNDATAAEIIDRCQAGMDTYLEKAT